MITEFFNESKQDGFGSNFIPSKLLRMTNTEQETQKAVAKFTVTKVLGQPTKQDINLLDNELTAIVSSFPTSLGGGLHRHAGLLKSVADYKLMAPGPRSLSQPILAFTQQEIFPQHNADNGRQSTKNLSNSFKCVLGRARD